MKIGKRILLVLTLVISLSSNRLLFTQAETTGSVTKNFANLVLFVQFSDTTGNFMNTIQDYAYQPKTYTQAAVRDYLDTTYAKSLVSYMDTISYGQFHVNTLMPQLNNGVIQPIVLSGPRSNYDDWSTIGTAQTEAMNIAVQNYGLSSLNLDQNSDGTVDNVTFIFAGGEDTRGNAFYAHKNNFDGSYQINNQYVGCINVLMADTIFGDDSVSTGEIAHEFMHSIGYPDLYHEGDGSPVGPWDLMAQASLYNQWPLAYLRSSVSKWLTIETVTSNSRLTLVPSSEKNGNQAYILKTGISDDEFFVVEYRKQGTRYSDELDVKIPGSGLIIYRINTKSENLSNKYGTDGVYVFRPGETSTTSDAGDIYSSFLSAESGRTAYGSADLNASITDNAIVYADGQNSGITISNVGSAGDTISFDVSFASTSNAGLWNNLGGTSVVSEADSSVLSMDVKANASYPSVLIGNPNGIETNNHQLSIYEYDGTNWVQTTSTINDFGNAAKFVYYDNIPYVLYSDSTNYRLKLVCYKNGTWVTVKNDFASNMVNSLELKNTGSSLYIAWNESASGLTGPYRNVIMKFNGTTFETVYEDATGYYSNMHISASGTSIFFSCRNYSANNQVIVLDLSSTTIKALPVPESKYSSAEICTDGKNLYLLCSMESDTNDTWLYQYNTDHTSIAKVGTKIPAQSSDTSSIVIYDGVPYVQVIDQSSTNKSTTVWSYQSNAWVREGLPLLAVNAAKSSIAMIGDMCYVAVINGNTPYVKMKSIASQTHTNTADPSITSITALAQKKDYVVRENFNAADVLVKGMYTNMSTTTLNYGTDYTIDFDTSSAGIKTVTIHYGTLSDSYQINVASVAVTGVSVSPSNQTLAIGATTALQTTVFPSNATNKNVTWTSDNSGVASVDRNGTIRGVSAGTTVIAVHTADGNKMAACTVTVYQPFISVTSISLNTDSLSLTTGASTTLHATVNPWNATNKGVTWASSNSNIVSVNGNGYVRAISPGSAVIVASTTDGNKTVSCSVSVSNPAPTIVPIPMYRLYNRSSGEHFYTASKNENDWLASLGWVAEGIGWTAPSTSNSPVYRLYNPYSGDHHYTLSINERDSLVPIGWRYEGIGWYSSDSQEVPIYRQFNPNEQIGTHNYTQSKSENDWLVTLGWRAEGIGWYGIN